MIKLQKKIKKGITLIVLVITIIIMIILAGTIIVSLNNSGIINSANKATAETNYKTVQAAAQLKYAENLIKNTNTTNETGEYIKSQLIQDKVITDEQAKLYKFKNNGDVIKLQTKEEYEAMYSTELSKIDASYYNVSNGIFTLTDAGKAATKDGTLTVLAIPYGVIQIGTETDSHSVAFDGVSLTKVIMPDTVTTIEGFSFMNCNNLNELVMSNAVEIIGYRAFLGSNFVANTENGLAIYGGWLMNGKDSTGDVVIPKSVDHIAQEAFKRNTNITSVTIPDTVYKIEYDAFTECKNLAKANGANNIREIDGNAFYSTSVYNNMPNGPVYFGKVLCRYIGTAPETFIIKEGTVSTSRVGMGYHTEIKTVIFPESFKLIKDMTFYRCNNLDNVVFKGGIENVEIEGAAFEETIIEGTLRQQIVNRNKYAFGYYTDVDEE